MDFLIFSSYRSCIIRKGMVLRIYLKEENWLQGNEAFWADSRKNRVNTERQKQGINCCVSEFIKKIKADHWPAMKVKTIYS